MKSVTYFAITLLLAALVPAALTAQKRPKYEDALPQILNSAPSEGLAILKIYLAEEHDNPSIYFQMGLIYEKRFLKADFLTENAKATGNAREVVNALERCLQFINEKEVRKNKEQYVNFAVFDAKGKYEVPWDSVKNKIDASKERAAAFVANIPAIYTSFTRSFIHYQEANKLFTSIVGSYLSIKDLYLLYSPDLEKKLDEISMHYDSTLHYFRQYKEATATYPVGAYNQQTKIQDVLIYRLDGLEVKINFLVPEIRIWNYRKWAEEVKSQTATNIVKLRQDIMTDETRLKNRLSSIEEEFASKKTDPLKTNKEIMFNLKKYDLVSVVEPLFLYKEAKHDLLYNKLQRASLDSAGTIDTDRRLFLYGQMINRIRQADSILVDIKKRNTQESYKKYKSFIDKHYKGTAGISSFVDGEQLGNRQDFSNYISSLNATLLQKHASAFRPDQVTFKGVKYDTKESGQVPDSIAVKTQLTNFRVQNFDGSVYLAGTRMNAKQKKVETFLLKMDDKKRVLWVNTYMLQADSAGYDSHTRPGAIQTTQEGVLLVLNGRKPDTGSNVNHLFLIDEAGKTVLSKRLLLEDFPRGVFYHERNNSYLIAFKGQFPEVNFSDMSELVVANHNIFGDLGWQYRMAFAGTFEKITAVDDGFILVNNFTVYRSKEGRLVKAGANPATIAPMLLKIDLEGKYDNIASIPSASSIYGNTLVRISDYCINLLGLKGEYRAGQLSETDAEGTFHVLFDSQLDVISSSAE